MDSLAQESALLNNFFVSPLSAPTRASLLTGKYHLSTGTLSVTNGYETMRSEETTIAEILKEEGYSTGCFGKWHNGAYYPNHPNGQGFDEFYGFCAGHWPNYFNTSLQHNGKKVETEGYINDVLTDKSIEFIKDNKQHPFLCYLALNTPHSPFQVPDKYFDKYKKMGLDDKNACIYGMCKNIDDNVGKIIKVLDSLSITNNTIFIFLSDNGPNGFRYNGNLKGKKVDVDEGGVKVPFIIRYPEKIKPSEINDIAAHIDILPTVLDFCNISFPDSLNIDGISLKPKLINNADQMTARPIFTHVAFSGELKDNPGAVRTPKYRLVNKETGYELYNMVNDPGQLNDISSVENKITDSLINLYKKWFEIQKSGVLKNYLIPVGYDEIKNVRLLAPDAKFTGNITYYEGHGWAHDWLTNWTSMDDTIWWDIDVVKPGNYEFSIEYTCPLTDIGSEILLISNNEEVNSILNIPYCPDFIPSPDRVKRQETYEKYWRIHCLGTIWLKEGQQKIIIKAK
ncbi:arylsulfatase, partial [Bacteroidota bacterium]